MKNASVAICLVLALAVLAGCTVENRLPGFAYFRLSADPTTLDPALVVDVPGGTITAKLFNGLVRLGDDLQIAPDIAHSWTVSPNGRVYRFHLSEGVTFSSGREVTARDFKYSFERVLTPETMSPKTWIFDHVVGSREFMDGKADEVSGIRVVDSHTLEIELISPFSPFLGLLTMPAAYVVPVEEVLHSGADFSSLPVGTGPYVLEEWAPNTRLVLRRREGYFGPAARVEGIVYRVIPEELTAVAEFELGNLDVIEIPPSEYSRYKRSEKWNRLISSTGGLNTYYLGLNNNSPAFSNPGLRRAANLAIDRERILGTLFEGRGTLATGPVPQPLRRWAAPGGYAYDPVKAKELVKAGGSEGARVDFLITPEQQVVDVAEVIQSYLKEAGFNVRIKQLEWSAFKEAVNKGEADMFWLSWWADYPDPENFLFPLFHSSNFGAGGNRVRYNNAEVDGLIEQGQKATTEQERNGGYEQAEEIIVRDAPWVFFWHKSELSVRQPWLANYAIQPVYSMDKGLDIAFSPK